MKMRLYSKITLSLIISILITFTGFGSEKTSPGQKENCPMDILVSTEWLNGHLNDPELVVLDCTVKIKPTETGGMMSVNGRESYNEGHIPGAGFADLMGDLSDKHSKMSYSLPSPEEFCKAMGRLGVGNNTRVVLYDSTNSVWAARVWWMLRWVGFDKAALLDGGLKAWIEEGRPISSDPVDYPLRKLTAAIRPELIAYHGEVLSAVNDENIHLIDSLPEPVFRGEMKMYPRAGHIKSAVNIPVLNLFDKSGRFKSMEELAALHPEDRFDRYITYCGGGIAASGSAFVMVRLGFKNVAVYMASLQEWTADPQNPMVETP